MDEESLRLDYWIDTRSDPQFPLWVIFKEIGHSPTECDQQPYARRSRQSVAELLKRVEELAPLASIAQEIKVSEKEVRAALWYAVWAVEHKKPPATWQSWNDRVDQAWGEGLFSD
ncbi:MAG: hypothetical protein M1294_03040 [Firmicutes bacterium]|jgi:uncharacterized protein (DUF433 family)|uniref:Uncharacterized protein n=1 Tax=Sulfobacillus benefaciens TaxID=453960 RepID=A0A2T2XBI5_9FIRM|nr:hypothetical protein [Bacillota bacterium]MCL5012423.1 hypothetical protein [Bacillota bacterium]PSR31806.1 MAG: hypothetical protein C7B43_00875 [Sulfobacillus benefaciens]